MGLRAISGDQARGCRHIFWHHFNKKENTATKTEAVSIEGGGHKLANGCLKLLFDFEGKANTNWVKSCELCYKYRLWTKQWALDGDCKF